MERHGIEVPQAGIARLCRHHRIRRLSLFGSFTREDFGPDSDIDVLVEFAPDATVGLLGLHAIEQELTQLLGGRKVDIVTPRGLSPYVRERVLQEAQVAYVAA